MCKNLSLDDLFIQQIKNTKQSCKTQDPWSPDCKFIAVRSLSIDERGRNAQEFLQSVFKLGGFRTQGDNEKTGNWDIKINNWRVEVKSATMDRTSKFQHESVHKTNDYDFIFFLDIAPNEIYFSCCKYVNIPWNLLHERGNESKRDKRTTGAGFKWDFKYNEKDKRLPSTYGCVKKVEDIISIFQKCNS